MREFRVSSTLARILGATLLPVGMVCSFPALAADTAMLVVDDSTGVTVAQFRMLGPCSSKAAGTNGCLKMSWGTSGPLNFILLDQTASHTWRFQEMQIRKPYENWATAESVDADILSDLQEIGGGGAFFTATGQHAFAGSAPTFQINDENQHAFIVQYRIQITNGTDDIWVHPILDNEGPNAPR
jgi:hypothetical protein